MFNGGLTYNNQPLRLSGQVENFDAFMRAQPTQARLTVGSNIINAEFNGTLGADGTISGPLKLGAHSVRSLAAWLGHPLPAGNGFGLMALEGQFVAADGVYSLRQAQIRFDSMSMNADLSFDTKPAVMAIKGNVTLDRLDLNPYLAPGTETDTVEAAKAAKAEANPDAPLSLGGLKAVDADVTMVVGSDAAARLQARSRRGGRNAQGRRAEGGLAQSILVRRKRQGQPDGGWERRYALDPQHARPLGPQGAAVPERVDGGQQRHRARARCGSMSPAAARPRRSSSRRSNGKGELRFADGNVVGVDLGAIARVMQSVVTAQVLTGAVGANAKTPFGQMGGSFTVKDGVLHTTDLKLTSDVVEMNGQGDVDLAAQTVDFRFEPVAKRGIPGLKLVDIGIPFLVKGPWDKPSYGPDPRGIARAVVNKLGQGAIAPVDLIKDPAGALKSLFGGR